MVRRLNIPKIIREPESSKDNKLINIYANGKLTQILRSYTLFLRNSIADRLPFVSLKTYYFDIYLKEKCSRCLGYGETGWATTTVWNKRTGERKRIRIFGPGVFWLFDTKEILKVQGKDMKISQEDL